MLSNNFNYINRLIAFGIFLLTFIVYFDTMAPTVSYWDCGEFIAVSHTLGVPHPPGSPFFLLLGRIFSMLPFNEDIAFRVNIISPLVSAFAVMLLYLSIVKVVTHWRGKVNSLSDCLIVFGGGVAGAVGATPGSTTAGAGGAGLASSITSSAVTRGGGGGGAGGNNGKIQFGSGGSISNI